MGVAEPWERLCSTCDGRGRVLSQVWAAWHQNYYRLEQIPDRSARLQALAQHVQSVPPGVEELTCTDCNGTGVVVTSAGETLLDFLARRFKPPAPSSPPPDRPANRGRPGNYGSLGNHGQFGNHGQRENPGQLANGGPLEDQGPAEDRRSQETHTNPGPPEQWQTRPPGSAEHWQARQPGSPEHRQARPPLARPSGPNPAGPRRHPPQPELRPDREVNRPPWSAGGEINT